MSTVLTGTPSNITTPLSATIASISGSSPITINTTAAHFFATGDSVFISGCTGNTSPNSGTSGPWVVTVTGTTSFTINTVNGGGTYTANSGTAVDYSLTPQVLVPTDGDTLSAQLSGLLSAYQSLLDRTQFLQAKLGTGTYRLVNVYNGQDNVSNPTFSANSFVAANTHELLTVFAQQGDLLDVSITGFLQPVSGSSTLHVCTGLIQAAYYELTSPFIQFGGIAGVSWTDNTSFHVQPNASVTCLATHTMASSTPGLVHIGINGYISTGDSEIVLAYIGWTVRQWRPNV